MSRSRPKPPSELMRIIDGYNYKKDPRLLLENLPPYETYRSNFNIFLKKDNLTSDQCLLLQIIDTRPSEGATSKREVDYLCVFRCTYSMLKDFGKPDKKIENNYRKLQESKAYIDSLAQTIEEMKASCKDDVTLKYPYDWSVDFLLVKAMCENDPNEWALIAWGPVWLPRSYLNDEYSQQLKQFEAQLNLAKAKESRNKRQKVRHQPQPAAVFYTLPDVPLLTIMGFIPMEELVKCIPLVCKRLNHLVPAAINKRTRLSLLINDPDKIILRNADNAADPSLIGFIFINPMTEAQLKALTPNFPGTENTRLCLAQISDSTVCHLIQLFPPKLQHLQIAINIFSPNELRNLVSLVQKCPRELKSAKLWINYFSSQDNPTENLQKAELFQSLFAEINKLKKLEELSFYTNTPIFAHPFPITYNFVQRLDLPFLSRLISFKFFSNDPWELVLTSLRNYAQPNGDLRHIQCTNPIYNEIGLNDSQFMERFTALNVSMQAMNLLRGATNITELYFDASIVEVQAREIREQTFMQVLAKLQELPVLQKLWLEWDFENNGRPHLSTFNNENANEVPQLRSLRELFILSQMRAHNALDCVHLRHIFPAVKLVTIRFYLPVCTVCHYVNATSIRSRRLRKCAEKLANTWRRFPELKKVRLQPDFNKELQNTKGDWILYDSLFSTGCINIKV